MILHRRLLDREAKPLDRVLEKGGMDEIDFAGSKNRKGKIRNRISNHQIEQQSRRSHHGGIQNVG